MTRGRELANSDDAGERGESEGGVGGGPDPGLGAERDEALDESRVGHEGDERAQVRKGVEAVDAGARMRPRGPGLDERARRREKQVRQADRRREDCEDFLDGLTRITRLPGGAGKDRR